MSEEGIDFQGFKIVKEREVEQVGARRVFKSNRMVESRQRFSLIQQRAIIIAISQIKREDQKMGSYKINLSDVLALPPGKKISGAQYKQVREELMKLTKTSIDLIKNDKAWKSYGFISSVEKKEWANYVNIRFNEEIKPFLLNLKDQYTSYFVKSVEEFRKTHSIRIYELCKQYLTIGHRKLGFEFLLDMLYLKNSKSYKQYYIFNSSVLKPCVKEINETSDIYIEYEPVRSGRKVTDILFRFKAKSSERKIEATPRKESEEKPKLRSDAEKASLAQRILPEAGYQRLVGQYGKDKVDYAIEMISARKEITNPRGYLIKALREGYFDLQFVREKDVSEKRVKAEAQRKEREDRKVTKDKISAEYDKFRRELLTRYFENSSEEDLEEFLFEHEISNNSQERKYVKEFASGKPSGLAKNFFASWLVSNYGSDEDRTFLSVELYAKSKYDFEWKDPD
ncbi:hypothetical protein FUAX_46480 (plasmid) [Fulvitalea axinellae]|uniref:Initiator Rep protein WH1 domain-containing protein n=1 Tax=Fulvitalea axinellae TaxID=1182444 RepID=A0AAU9CJC5_9BACT|nr:hypothetical protein FUAX_46480 [Fulvitalea axinellae]